ncbi:MAG: tetratricopeptide repeat protein [Alphaproteobacteria bacterium]
MGRIVALALALVAAVIAPAIAGDVEDCNQSEDPGLRIVGCTAMLLSGEWTDGELPPIYNLRGVAYNRLGLAQQAIDDFDAALELDPDYLYAYINRGWAYNELPQYLRALEDFNHVIAVAPGTPIAYLGRGVTQMNQGMLLSSMIADFDKAIDLMPTFSEAYYYRGNAYRGHGEYGRAIADYDQAIQLDPGAARVYRARALAYCRIGDRAAAVADFNRQWDLAPQRVGEDQQMLTERRLYRGTISGIADPATQSALKSWVGQRCS